MAAKPHTAKLKKRRPIEDELSELQDAHRLAIHIWEGNEMWSPNPSYVFPNFSWKSLTAYPAEEIATRIADKTMPIMSMSLLPSTASQLGMRPYSCSWNQSFMHCGYLVGLSQDGPHPARVLRASLHGLGSGPNPLDKAPRLGRKGVDEVPELTALYDTYLPPRKRGKARKTAEGEEALRQAVAGENGSQLSATQLDLLGNHYDTHTSSVASMADEPANLVDFNEILVASSRPHIKAIVVPLLQDSYQKKPWCEPMTKLAGALAGLQHLEENISLPVVIYHATEPNIGTFTFLAHGKSECLKVALAACKELYEQQFFGGPPASNDQSKLRTDLRFEKLRANIMQEMEGLDITKPLTKQKSIVALLEREARSAARSRAE